MKLSFKRWELSDNRSVAAIFQGCRRGIYVLEFENGERYVGKTGDIVGRYNEHRHRSTHHTPWTDIIAIQFLEIREGALDQLEIDTIEAFRVTHKLRNKTHNPGHCQPSPFRKFFSFEDQEHWFTGQPTYDFSGFAEAAGRPQGETPKLLLKRRGQERLPDGRLVWEAIVDDLAVLVPLVIPSPVETEAEFWSLSDYPSTAGGRFVTLNVGRLELAFYPRKRFEHKSKGLNASNGLIMRLNAMIRTFHVHRDLSQRFPADNARLAGQTNRNCHTIYRMPKAYSIPVDGLEIPLGCFRRDTLSDKEILGVRKLVIQAMGSGSARVNVRSYSAELTRLVYKRALELNGLISSATVVRKARLHKMSIPPQMTHQ